MLQKTLLVCAAVGGALLVLVGAQAQAAPNAPLAAPDKSGYDLLIEAGTKLLPGPNGGASNADPTISPAENLKRERLAVARNASARALVRLALQKPIEVPQKAAQDLFPMFAHTRELARQFSQESDVRLADGDFVGAMNSKLDTIELGAVMQRGSLISGLVGIAIEAIGTRSADKIAVHLDAAQCRAAAARLEHIEARRATFAQVLRDEGHYSLQLEIGYLADFKAKANLQPDEDGDFPTKSDIEQIKTLSVEKLTGDNARLFDALVQQAALPYSKTPTALPPAAGLNPFTRSSLMVWDGTSRTRFNFARPVAQNFLLRSALELRAQKLESGAYPDSLAVPIDPFSPDSKPLVYRKTASGYLLYSVGPDARDDGGAGLRTIVTDEQNGAKSFSDRLMPDSTGDIVQTPF